MSWGLPSRRVYKQTPQTAGIMGAALTPSLRTHSLWLSFLCKVSPVCLRCEWACRWPHYDASAGFVYGHGGWGSGCLTGHKILLSEEQRRHHCEWAMLPATKEKHEKFMRTLTQTRTLSSCREDGPWVPGTRSPAHERRRPPECHPQGPEERPRCYVDWSTSRDNTARWMGPEIARNLTAFHDLLTDCATRDGLDANFN